MDFSKPKPSYLSLKRNLQTTKYKLKYSKTQEKYLVPNTSFPNTSKLPTRKPSEVTLKHMNPENTSMEKSTLYHFEQPVELSDSFDTCFYPLSKNKYLERQIQTEKNNPSCTKCGQKYESILCQEIKVLKSEVITLREALKEIQNTLGMEKTTILSKKVLSEDSEDKRSFGYNRLQEKLSNMQRLYEF